MTFNPRLHPDTYTLCYVCRTRYHKKEFENCFHCYKVKNGLSNDEIHAERHYELKQEKKERLIENSKEL